MSLPTKANVSRPESYGYHALIEYGNNDADSLYLPLAVAPNRPMTFQTVEPQLSPLNLSENPEDMRPESGKTFSRSSFIGGEGLDFAHQEDASKDRFWDSDGLDVAPDQAGSIDVVTLTHTMTLLRDGSSGGATGPMIVTPDNTMYAVVSNDKRVDKASNPVTGSPSWTVEDPQDGEGDQIVYDLANLGNDVYAAIATNGIHRRVSGTWSHWSDLNTSTAIPRVWAVKGRIVASTGAALYEAASGSGSTLLKTLPTGQTWKSVVDSGSAILAASSHGEITMFVDEDGSLVEAAVQVMPGESITSMASQFGLVFICTDGLGTSSNGPGRFYRGALSGLQIVNLQLIREFDYPLVPYAVVCSRDAAYFSTEQSGNHDIWRYDLSTGGLSRYLGNNADNEASSIVLIGDVLFTNNDDDGILREDSTYEDTGYVISPLADFYNAAVKTWMGGRLSCGSIPTDCSVELHYSTDPAAIEDPTHSSWTSIVTYDDGTSNAASDAEVALTGVESRWVALMAVLNGEGAGASTPELRGFSIRGVHQPTEEDYQIPVNISDQLESPGRRPLTVSGVGDTRYEALKALQGKSATVTLLRPDESVKGQIRFISTPIQDTSGYGSPTVYCNMLVRGQKQ